MKRNAARKPAKKRRAVPRCVPGRLREKLRDNVAQAVALLIGNPAFDDVLQILQEVGGTLSIAEQERFAAAVRERIQLVEQRRENGELVAAEGRAARSRNTSANDRIICTLYRSVRGSFPTGGKGNTAALDVVRQRHQRKTNRDRPIDRRTVRNALKRAGIPCE